MTISIKDIRIDPSETFEIQLKGPDGKLIDGLSATIRTKASVEYRNRRNDIGNRAMAMALSGSRGPERSLNEKESEDAIELGIIVVSFTGFAESKEEIIADPGLFFIHEQIRIAFEKKGGI